MQPSSETHVRRCDTRALGLYMHNPPQPLCTTCASPLVWSRHPHMPRAVVRTFLDSTGTARAQRPTVNQHSRDHPEHPAPPRELRPRGNNSRFRQQSGICSGKHRLF